MKRIAALALSLLISACATAGGPSPAGPRWVGVWGASPTPPPANAKTFENQTIRQVVRISAGGSQVRIRLSNEYSDKPLAIGGASIALADDKGQPTASPLRLTFGGRPTITMPAKAPVFSDPVALNVAALSHLSVSLYLPEATGPCTCHPDARETAFVSPTGDYTLTGFEPAGTFTTRAFLTGVEVRPMTAKRVIVTFGDSITDGTRSTIDTDQRWPDVLAARLDAAGGQFSVVNAAISGNRVLSHANALFGENALSRLERDALSVPGVTHMTVLEGINDLGMGRPNPPSADQLIAGYSQIIARAHAHGVKVIGGTLLPYEGAAYYSAEGDAIRAQVNQWIRTGGAFDGVIDFDAVMKDPANPKKMKADLQSGDWLHPNDAGYKVMGEAVDLALFK